MSYVQGKPLIESFISFGLENKSFDRPISGLEARHAKVRPKLVFIKLVQSLTNYFKLVDQLDAGQLNG